MTDGLSLVLGLVCAGVGGELFLRGVVGVADWARVSAGIVAATLAAFATSSPELAVAISSALAEKPEISLGDALGSNVINIALILGVATLVAPIRVPRDGFRRDYSGALLAPLAVGALGFDGALSRTDGWVLLGAFALWLAVVFRDARRQRAGAAASVLGESRPALALLFCLVGLALLIAAGRLIVSGALGIAAAFGLDSFVISATVVAFGTSVPELATALVSQLRRRGDVGLGTIFGSNIFNALFIIGVAASIHPIRVEWHSVALTLLFGVVTVAVALPLRSGTVRRTQGGVLVACYALFVVVIF